MRTDLRGASIDRLAGIAYRVFPWILLPVMLAVSVDFGVTWDEATQQRYGERILEYFRTGFADRSALAFGRYYLYGGMFDVLCLAAQSVVPADPFVVRHLVNAAVGWTGILFCGWTAERLFGWKTGFLAMVLLATAPRYFGHSMNNPKDIPFAAAAAVVLFCLAGVSPRYPYLSWRRAAVIGGAIALTINVRAGGLLFVCYLALLLAVLILRERQFTARVLGGTALRFAAAAILALVAGTAFWPWAQVAPLSRPFAALTELTHYDWTGPVLYAGEIERATGLPWHYPFVMIGITTPPVILAGLVLAVVGRGREGWRRAGLWFAGLFPIVYVVARESTLYDGIRHLLFILPPLVVLAAAGWLTALEGMRSSRLRWFAAAALAIGLAEPVVFHLRNHPNQVVYFNGLVGGPRGAAGRFELDYWGNSVLQAVAWIDARVAPGTGRLRLAGGPASALEKDSARYSSVRFVGGPDRGHHLWVAVHRAMPKGELQAWVTDPAVLHVVTTADGAPLSVVRRGPLYDRIPPLRSAPRGHVRTAPP